MSVSGPRVYDDQSDVAIYVIKNALERGAKEVEVTKEAEDAWVQENIKKSVLRKSFLENCTPGMSFERELAGRKSARRRANCQIPVGYYNFEGETNRLAERNSNWGSGPIDYRNRMQDWIKEGEMKGLEVRA